MLPLEEKRLVLKLLIQVREGGLVGTLFIPNKTPAPAIITIFGGVNR